MSEEHDDGEPASVFEQSLSRQHILDDNFGRFPKYMSLTSDVFSFEYHSLKKIITRFSDSANLSSALSQAKQVILDSNLTEETKLEVLQLLDDELSMLSFSQIAKSSVIKI